MRRRETKTYPNASASQTLYGELPQVRMEEECLAEEGRVAFRHLRLAAEVVDGCALGLRGASLRPKERN